MAKFFTEETMYKQVEHQLPSQLTGEDWTKAWRSMSESVRRMRKAGDLDRLDVVAKFSLVRWHVQATRDDVNDDLDSAVSSALDLRRMVQSQEYALELSRLAERWLLALPNPDPVRILAARLAQAQSLFWMEQTGDAERLLRDIVAECEGLPEEPTVLYEADELLGLISSNSGNLVVARGLLEKAVSGFVRAGMSTDALRAKSNLARVCSLMGDHATGLEIQSEVLAERERALGPEAFMTIVSRRNVVRDLANLNRKEAALELMSRVVQGFTEVLGEQHEETILAEAEVGTLLGGMGDVQAAVVSLHQAYVDAQTFLELDSHATLKIGVDLATALCARKNPGDEADSLALLDQLIDIAGASHDPTHFSRLNAFKLRATIRESRLEFEDAFRDFDACAFGWGSLLGTNSLEFLEAWGNRCRLLADTGRRADALFDLSVAVETAQRSLGVGNRVTIGLRIEHAALAIRERDENARPLSESVLSDAYKTDPTAIRGILCTWRLAAAWESVEEWDASLALLSTAYDTAVQRLGDEHPLTRKVDAALEQLHLLLGE